MDAKSTGAWIGKIVLGGICILGILGSFFQWVGVKPKDLAMTQSIFIPHSLWLLLAVVLFAAGIGPSIWSVVIQRREITRLRSLQKLENESDSPLSIKIGSPQELRHYAITTIGDLYEFLIDLDDDPRKPRDRSGCGVESAPEVERIKSAFPGRFRNPLSIIEVGADRYGFWKAMSFKFYGSSEMVSRLKGEVNNADDVHRLIDALIDLGRVHTKTVIIGVNGDHSRAVQKDQG
jgi:hypothetical protein